jgi:hypothetical protein
VVPEVGEMKTKTEAQEIRWAPRVQPGLIKRLYKADARGIVDEELMDRVGYDLLDRCRDILRVSERRCWKCGGRLGGEPRRGSRLKCADCGWSASWTAYRRSYRGNRTHGPRALPAVKAYLRDFPRASGWSTRMVVIDRLVHSVHESFGDGQDPCVTPLAVNLIEGTAEDTFLLLESLAVGDLGTRGLREAKRAWQDKLRSYAEYKAERARKAEEVKTRRRRNRALRDRLRNRPGGT